MADGSSSDIGFSNLTNFKCRDESCINTCFFEGTLYGHAIDHGGHHTHIIALHPFDAGRAALESSENITTSDHHSYFNTELCHPFDLLGIVPGAWMPRCQNFVHP